MKSISHDRGDNPVPRSVTLSPIYTPMATIKCAGPATFRSQQARDFACLLDLDPDIVHWSATPPLLSDGGDEYQLDFVAITETESFLIDVGQDEPSPPLWVTSAAATTGHQYRPVAMADFESSHRLRNCKDLLRYGFYRPMLGDRIRILAALDEMGSLNVAECMSAVKEGRPMPTLAALILQGFLEVELDDVPIGPDTQVRRIRG